MSLERRHSCCGTEWEDDWSFCPICGEEYWPPYEEPDFPDSPYGEISARTHNAYMKKLVEYVEPVVLLDRFVKKRKEV